MLQQDRGFKPLNPASGAIKVLTATITKHNTSLRLFNIHLHCDSIPLHYLLAEVTLFMDKIRILLGKIPLFPLIMISIMLGLAPFVPEPHLWEKLKMLANGTLTKPVDIFDMLMHSLPVTILILKLAFQKKDI